MGATIFRQNSRDAYKGPGRSSRAGRVALWSAMMLFAAALVLDFDPAWGLEKTNGKSPSFFYSFSYTPLYQFETDLNRSGSFDVSRHYLRFDVMRRFNRNLRAGVGLSYDFEKWDFNNLSTVAGASPWSKIHRPGISLPVFYSFADSWTLGVIPSIELAGESGARSSESLTSGAVVSLAHPFSQRLALGLGFGIFDRLEKTRIFPFILINWEINEQLRLSNPLRAGPAGPAGLELVYMLHRWELGIGGAYRSYRFRLDDTSAAPNGVGENEFVAAFFRVQRKLGPNLALDLAAGGLFAGELTVEDSNGIKIGADEYDTSPFVALTLAGKF